MPDRRTREPLDVPGGTLTATRLPATAAEHAAEHFLGHLRIDLLAAAPAWELEAARKARPGRAGRNVGAELVVDALLLRITQRVVGVLNFLEATFGSLVARIAIRM